LTNSYVYAHAQVLLQHPGDWTAAKYFYMHDRLGSVRLVFESVWDTASSQYKPVVRNLYTYDAYGKRLGEGADTIETVYNPFQFTGQWYDAEIGQYYLRARQYDPQLLRFTSRDPVFGGYEDPMSLHAYLYCWNNPINMVDPSGEFLADITIGQGVSAALRGYGTYDTAKRVYGYGMMVANGCSMRALIATMAIDTVFDAMGGAAFKGAAAAGKKVFSTAMNGLESLARAFSKNGNLNAAYRKIKEHMPSIRFPGGRGGPVPGPDASDLFEDAIHQTSKHVDGSGGVTVLGKYGTYNTIGGQYGFNFMDVDKAVWDSLDDAERWAVNKKFLDDAVKRGDTFYLSNPDASDFTGGYSRELEYLNGLGYQVNGEFLTH